MSATVMFVETGTGKHQLANPVVFSHRCTVAGINGLPKGYTVAIWMKRKRVWRALKNGDKVRPLDLLAIFRDAEPFRVTVELVS